MGIQPVWCPDRSPGWFTTMNRSLIVFIVISGTIAVCGICGLGLFTGFGNPEREYRAELAKGAAVGLPENPEDYQIRTPESENAA